MNGLKLYPACDTCAHYVCTGDGTVFDGVCADSDDADLMLSNCDATVGAILRDDNVDYLLESCAEIPTAMTGCTFCGDVETVNQVIQGVVK